MNYICNMYVYTLYTHAYIYIHIYYSSFQTDIEISFYHHFPISLFEPFGDPQKPFHLPNGIPILMVGITFYPHCRNIFEAYPLSVPT